MLSLITTRWIQGLGQAREGKHEELPPSLFLKPSVLSYLDLYFSRKWTLWMLSEKALPFAVLPWLTISHTQTRTAPVLRRDDQFLQRTVNSTAQELHRVISEAVQDPGNLICSHPEMSTFIWQDISADPFSSWGPILGNCQTSETGGKQGNLCSWPKSSLFPLQLLVLLMLKALRWIKSDTPMRWIYAMWIFHRRRKHIVRLLWVKIKRWRLRFLQCLAQVCVSYTSYPSSPSMPYV